MEVPFSLLWNDMLLSIRSRPIFLLVCARLLLLWQSFVVFPRPLYYSTPDRPQHNLLGMLC